VKTSTPIRLIPALIAAGAFAQETPITPTVKSVGLFKNGLSVIRASFEAKSPGTYLWTDPPRCVHGTFLVESDTEIALRSGNRRMEVSAEDDPPSGVLQKDLAGRNVRVRMRGPHPAGEIEIVGLVWKMPIPPLPPRQWDNAIAGEGQGYPPEARPGNMAGTTGNYLVIDAEQKRLYIDVSQIASVEVAGAAPERKRMVEKPVLLFTATKAGLVNISYLTRGASWVPSYHVDLSDPKTLQLKQTALIRNELQPWKNAELQLISGFPNVRFGHVDSPLWPQTTLTNFFGQISRQPRIEGGAATQQVAYNSARFAEAVAPELPIDGSQSEDLHFERIGERDLDPGETLAIDVARGSASYERVVEWTSADTRGENGKYQRNDRRTDQDEPWDAVLFQNPLKFPMTTAAATITERGQFRGQNMSEWTNPGQRACLQITRALSIQADRQEVEEQSKREPISIDGYSYYRATVRGTLTIRNFRAQPVVILSRAHFSGDLLAADEKPSDTLRREGIFSINPRHELEWKFTLAAGAEKVFNFRYSVLVRN
jgi:Domain of unknown function (DUF4139)